MGIKIPTAAEVRERLSSLKTAQIQALSDASSVPFTTLLKIKNGITENPRLDTVEQFYSYIDAVKGLQDLTPQPTETSGARLCTAIEPVAVQGVANV